ncbi:MAG: preprotein translocase subunit YajC [Akkermansiaceae bacterium]|nr:preprotein translocase subunit YajC [Akkermansiaceae bacterium]NJR42457.1 preprotein translocase subunit YajC [Akkermansiaceae bacterium]
MIFQTSFILAETAAPGGILGNPLIMLVVMVVMFYFLLIRPQQMQRKELNARIAALQSGDKVVLTSGLYGIIHTVKEKTVMVKVAEGTMLEFDKAAVATVQKK